MPIETTYIIHRLGLLYSIYRLVLACSLMLTFVLTFNSLKAYYSYPDLYLYTSITYIIFALVQMTLIRFVNIGSPVHLIAMFAVDVVILGILTFALVHGVNLQIGLIYMIAVFLSSVLLDKKFSLIIMLSAIISVTYQNFIGGIFSSSLLRDFTNNILLAFLFIAMHHVGRIALERFKILENMTIHQSEELSQLQGINQSIMQQIDVGYLLINKQAQIVLSNPRACQLLGLPQLVSYEKYPLEVWQDEFYQYIQEHSLICPDEHLRHHAFHFHSHQSGYKMNVKWHILHTANEPMTLFILKDTQEINQQVQQLKLAALGQLSASIAHEIRNPLSAIVQANELLKDELSEDAKMLSNMISKQAERINKIIQSTLGMAKNDGVHAVMIHLQDFVQGLLDEDLNDVKEQIQVEIEPESCIYFDQNQLRQVMINLVRNALRHNQSEQAIIIRTQMFEQLVWIDVIDFGQGVEKSQQANLFKPFFSTEINGTGLGLYLSSSFCEANHATLRYIDEYQGACFRIEGLACQMSN